MSTAIVSSSEVPTAKIDVYQSEANPGYKAVLAAIAADIGEIASFGGQGYGKADAQLYDGASMGPFVHQRALTAGLHFTPPRWREIDPPLASEPQTEQPAIREGPKALDQRRRIEHNYETLQ
jgi:hypothetical protein